MAALDGRALGPVPPEGGPASRGSAYPGVTSHLCSLGPKPCQRASCIGPPAHGGPSHAPSFNPELWEPPSRVLDTSWDGRVRVHLVEGLLVSADTPPLLLLPLGLPDSLGFTNYQLIAWVMPPPPPACRPRMFFLSLLQFASSLLGQTLS